MKFHLQFDIKKLPQQINHQQKLLLMGSCFTENIGAKLNNYKFNTLLNPNGILFNPVSVADALHDYIENKKFFENDLFFLNEGWHSWKHHSRFSDLTIESTLSKINSSTSDAHNFLQQADVLMITLGSAWTYTFTDKAINATIGNVAANNHKAPANWFVRKLMTPKAVADVLQVAIERLHIFNPKLQIIFTISPVRHVREGVVENTRSKAVLVQAVHQLVDTYNHLYYFPAYEIVLDDLRDYRFYSEDLVHPNYHATQYVWEKFVDACMNAKTKLLMEEIYAILGAYQHKPFNPSTQAHKTFLKTFYERTVNLQTQNPFLDLSKELNYFRQL